MFRFAIRDLLWLTVVVALGVAWCVDRSRLAAEIKYLRDNWWQPVTDPQWKIDDKTDLDSFIDALNKTPPDEDPDSAEVQY